MAISTQRNLFNSVSIQRFLSFISFDPFSMLNAVQFQIPQFNSDAEQTAIKIINKNVQL